MVRILISGYYGFDNAGDDSVLYGIIWSLNKHIPGAELAVLSNKPAETQNLFGIPSYNRWKIGTIVQELKKCDLLIMGGGSLLQDATSPRSVLYYLGIVLMAKMLRKPVIFYAQGVGPITKEVSKKLVQVIVNKVDIITVRDKESEDDLRNLGVKKAPIYITADPAVMINQSHIDSTQGKDIILSYQQDGTRPIMGISVRSWKNQQHFKDVIAQLADEYIGKGWDVFFLPMQNPSDLKPSQDILDLMKEKKHAYLIEERLTFHEIISFISSCDCILGMRLHSVILAAALDIPFVGISYDPKMERFVQRIGMETAGNIEDLDYEVMQQKVEIMLQNPERSKQEINKKMAILVEEAEKSSQLALQLLRKPEINKNLKVIHVIGGGEFGGAEQHILELLTILKKKSVETQVVCFYNSTFAQELTKRGIPVIVIDQFSKMDYRFVKELRNVFKRENPLLIHSHGVRANFLCRLAARPLPHLPVITTVHSVLRYDYPNTISYFLASRMEFWTRQWNKHYIAISKAIRQILLNEGINEKQITLIHHGIDIEEFNISESKDQIRDTLGIPKDAFVIGSVSRLVPIKGLNDILNALSQVIEKFPNIHWLAVGEGPERQNLDLLVKTRNLEGNIHFLGFRQDIPRCLKAMDLFISSSYSEGFGLSLIEAMASRIPIISTPVGGISDFLLDHINGLAVPSHRPDEIARCIIKLYENPQLREKLISAAYQTVHEKFTLEKMADHTLDLYNKLYREEVKSSPL